jgi:hypothetical protein
MRAEDRDQAARIAPISGRNTIAWYIQIPFSA